jgi:hypothetical protein
MTDLITFLLSLPFEAAWMTYKFYILAVFSIMVYRQWQKGTLNLFNKVLFAPILLAFFIADVIVNYTLLTAAMGQTPYKTHTISDRFNEYRTNALYALDWRKTVADMVCGKFLNTVDPTGQHC